MTFVIIMAVFATVWTYAGTSGLSGAWNLWSTIGALIISIIVGIIIVRRTSISHSKSDPPKNWKIYWITVGFEALAIPVSISILQSSGLNDDVLAAIAIIVGIHFFGLVTAFRAPIFLWTGIAMC
jgi:hypothetical protein